MLGLLIFSSVAFAAGPQAPALKKPEALYGTYFEKTDGSEQLVYLLLDQTNDERRSIEQNGALEIHQSLFNDAGEVVQELYITLQNCDFGKMMITSSLPSPQISASYAVGDRLYRTALGLLLERKENPDAQYIDYCWENVHFPYGPLQVLNAVREDGWGYKYFLARSDEGKSFEFVSDAGMFIEELRIYLRNENGDLALNSVLKYSLGKAKPIPAMVQSAMREDFENGKD